MQHTKLIAKYLKKPFTTEQKATPYNDAYVYNNSVKINSRILCNRDTFFAEFSIFLARSLMYYFQNESECFIGISNCTKKQLKARGRRPKAFIVSRCLDTSMTHKARVLEITSHDHS